VLDDVLELINAEALKDIWTEDETIGWIYQYFTPKELRDQARKESAAPRNSYELAFRNQFFTPRYVVRFLGDNTLGRIWYEMMQGRTRLAEKCEYMVRRPNEVWLKEGEQPPNQEPRTQEPGHLSQEELLRQPVHIPFRAKKDPRDIKLLDPAEGSGHFLLYGFDLMEVIYLEAWDDPDLGKPLKADFQTLEAYKRQIPELILRHNLHGIDIDLRAVQIAALALWLRAQRAWQEMGTPADQRPKITKSNLVCAEPMPGEADLLEEFVADLQPRVLGQLVRVVFDKMKLAGEAGSLLKIEEELHDAITAAKKQWQAGPQKEQMELFVGPAKPKQEQFAFDLAGVTDEQFWNEAESRVLAALNEYATRAIHNSGFTRLLFAEDAARGFAFVDLCQKRFDIVLMNPPFGEASLPSKAYLDETYGDTKGDVYKAFVECFQSRLVPSGVLGVLSSRTGFFLGQSEDWRTRVVLRLFRPTVLADLGSGVLDAMVEVAAYVLRSLSASEANDLTISLVPVLERVIRDKQDRFSIPKWQAARDGLKRHQAVAELERLVLGGFIQRCPGDPVRYTPIWDAVRNVLFPGPPVFPAMTCIRALADQDKSTALLLGISDHQDSRCYTCIPSDFETIPGAPFAYWISAHVRSLFSTLPPLEADGRTARRGPSTGNDFRLVRVWWEIPPISQVSGQLWVSFAKGGRFSPFYSDPPAVVNWDSDRFTFSGFYGRPGRMLERLESSDVFFRPGITWPLRGIRYSAQAFPSGGVFSIGGKFATWDDSSRLTELLAIANSKAFDYWIGLFAGKVGGVQYESGLISKVPYPRGTAGTGLAELGYRGWSSRRSVDTGNAVSHAFVSPSLLAVTGQDLAERGFAWTARLRESEAAVGSIQAEIDVIAFRLYGLDAAECAALTAAVANQPITDANNDAGDAEEDESASSDLMALTSELLDYAPGCAFGRWDIRYATADKSPAAVTDAFAPLPVCSPGMLQNASGLPAESKDVPQDYPIAIDWDGILVDDPDHEDDIVRRVRDVLAVIWKDRAEAIEQEACGILGVKELRDYFRKPGNGGFWMDHVKRYSKSRRKAPIYWLLQSAGKNYALWIYYHRLDKDLLLKALVKYVEPKLKLERDRVEQYRNELLAAGSSGRSAKALERRLADQEDLLSDLQDFHDKLRRAADLRLEPDLNDGVVLNIAPLWELVPWKEAKSYWDELMGGEYEWSSIGKQLRAKGLVRE
jgi:hypothetical protein